MDNQLINQEIVWNPDEKIVAESNLHKFMLEHGISTFEELLERADSDAEWWWRAMADRIDFMKPYTRVLNVEKGIEFPVWCEGGTTNIVLNAIDRHRSTPVWKQPAIIGETEAGETRIWTYEDLNAHTSRLAAGLRSLGVGKGDVVAVYMPNINEAISGILAVAKIGGIVMPLFSGFGVEAIVSRLTASGAVAILTVDGTTRRGRWAPMKEFAVEAARKSPGVKHVICLYSQEPTGKSELEVDWQALCAGQPSDVPTEEMGAEDPVMLVYTSGTTGQPKGTVHTHVGFAAKMSMDMGLFMDLKPSDRIVWLSDIGWLVGPMLAFGATVLGAAFVLADGAPDYPSRTRLWQMVEKHKATFLGLAPTLIRGFMHGEGIGSSDVSSIRLCVSTGEAWTPEAWWWTFEHVLNKRGPIINYSGGTEIGGAILTGSVIRPMKPCSFSGPVPGMGADIVDGDGNSVPPFTVGELVLRKTSIGLSRSLWKDDERYLDSYWRDIPGMWRQGDWAVRDDEGFWYVLGRSDDTLKIAGKRTGPAEIEALLLGTGKVVEAAAIGIPDPIKGETVGCVVVLDEGVADGPEIRKEISDAVISGLGHPYKPGFVAAVKDLPKTRNMKVMRRLVKAACLGKPFGDTSSLVNPEALDGVREVALKLGLGQQRES